MGSGLTLLMLTPEIAGRVGLRDGCRHEEAEEVHAGVPPRGSSSGAGYGPADRACGRGDRRGRAAAGPLGPARTRAPGPGTGPGSAVSRGRAGRVEESATPGR